MTTTNLCFLVYRNTVLLHASASLRLMMMCTVSYPGIPEKLHAFLFYCYWYSNAQTAGHKTRYKSTLSWMLSTDGSFCIESCFVASWFAISKLTSNLKGSSAVWAAVFWWTKFLFLSKAKVIDTSTYYRCKQSARLRSAMSSSWHGLTSKDTSSITSIAVVTFPQNKQVTSDLNSPWNIRCTKQGQFLVSELGTRPALVQRSFSAKEFGSVVNERCIKSRVVMKNSWASCCE